MNKYRMCIAYEGTRYSGWQIQPNSLSIQEIIEKALETRMRAPIRLIGAGRTDAGVHALGQTAHFSSPCDDPLDCQRMHYALNGLLPPDIRIKELAPTREDFHAQYSALSKEYHYHLWLEKTVDPFCRLYRHHFPDHRFSLPSLQEAASHFVGTHDFATFANVGGKVVSTVRTLIRLDAFEQEGGIRLEFQGNGFLYKMVRNIVGTLLEVATGRRKMVDIQRLLDAKDRRQAGSAAPAPGLFLVRINYPSQFLKSAGNESNCTKERPVSLEI